MTKTHMHRGWSKIRWLIDRYSKRTRFRPGLLVFLSLQSVPRLTFCLLFSCIMARDDQSVMGEAVVVSVAELRRRLRGPSHGLDNQQLHDHGVHGMDPYESTAATAAERERFVLTSELNFPTIGILAAGFALWCLVVCVVCWRVFVKKTKQETIAVAPEQQELEEMTVTSDATSAL